MIKFKSIDSSNVKELELDDGIENEIILINSHPGVCTKSSSCSGLHPGHRGAHVGIRFINKEVFEKWESILYLFFKVKKTHVPGRHRTKTVGLFIHPKDRTPTQFWRDVRAVFSH